MEIVGVPSAGMRSLPTAVAFQHVAPADVSEHQRLFNCAVKFGAAENRLSFNLIQP